MSIISINPPTPVIPVCITCVCPPDRRPPLCGGGLGRELTVGVCAAVLLHVADAAVERAEGARELLRGRVREQGWIEEGEGGKEERKGKGRERE